MNVLNELVPRGEQFLADFPDEFIEACLLGRGLGM